MYTSEQMHNDIEMKQTMPHMYIPCHQPNQGQNLPPQMTNQRAKEQYDMSYAKSLLQSNTTSAKNDSTRTSKQGDTKSELISKLNVLLQELIM